MRIYSNWNILAVEKDFYNFFLFFGGIEKVRNIFRMFVLVPTKTVRLLSAFGSLKALVLV